MFSVRFRNGIRLVQIYHGNGLWRMRSLDDGILVQQVSDSQEPEQLLCRLLGAERIVAKIDHTRRHG